MIAYFDASALAKRYVEEEHRGEVLAWLARSTAATSRLSEIEIASALARRCREGALSASERDRALDALDADLRALHVVEVSAPTIERARGALLRHGLQAADAVQLASALMLRDRSRAPVTFVAFDDRLNAAAEVEGLVLPSRAG